MLRDDVDGWDYVFQTAEDWRRFRDRAIPFAEPSVPAFRTVSGCERVRCRHGRSYYIYIYIYIA